MSPRAVEVDGFLGEAADGLAVAAAELPALARRLLDPGAAEATIHWGRNYLYRLRVETGAGPLDVVAKQFRERGRRARWARRRRGSKALRSWRMAEALAAAGIATPEPLLWLESPPEDGISLFVTRFLPGRTEARYLLRARNGAPDAGAVPSVDFDAFLAAAAVLARRLHDAGIWHRDFSAGNLLVLPDAADGIEEIALVDLNRARRLPRVSLGRRMRDLARLPLERADDRRRLLERYFDQAPPPAVRLLYGWARVWFHGRHRWKNRLRGAWARLRSWLVPRGTHAHIPPPPEGADARDKIVWDRLSDQPHSHAGRLERARVRIGDAGDHLASFAALAGALPRIRRAHRELVRGRNAKPFAWPGVGVALRPWPDDPRALLAAFDELRAPQALIRLHPWQTEHDDEERLAAALAERGVELTFTLPQTRELVRDRARWRRAVGELGARFARYGRRFQIGQAINRSKWGVWSYGDYLELAADAARILREIPAVELAGPAVIDFEAHATAAVVNRKQPGLRFDALASLLYVDRRGAPENRQLGYDASEKATLLTAIAASSRLIGSSRHWVTEVNWPLAEGPHSPAGRSVAVDEARQADYLARYYLTVLGTGCVERVFWWQLVAKGYGLVDPSGDGGLRRRASFRALATLARSIPPGTRCLGPQPAPAGVRRYRFVRDDGSTLEAVWSLGAPAALELAAPPKAAWSQEGAPLGLAGTRLELDGSVRYVLS